ncbi:MAG TPA: cytochrome b N-terminal domain-containing protein [Bryobacteraceae bacterium]|nr:cytochrome b N-terminal domain-containing protein [Bryobacteraceae bacterium]
MFRRLLDWLEDRTGVEGAVKRFLYEDIPHSSGWHQVFGSVALFAFLVQASTGILLALNYAPTPGEAYDSLRYLLRQVTAGRLMRAMHHWGASLMIIVVVVHMIQTFVWGAYKKPREATWIAGVALLLLTLAYGLSGYLLPWDNRAYWGTVVTTEIAALVPGVGPLLVRLLGSDGTSIGAVTFTRFYVAHVQLLPPLTALLIALHIYLVRRHGVTPTPEDENHPRKKFYPEQVAKDTVAIFVWFALLMGMSILARVPLGRVADPTDLSYVPRPEWYFLFLFQFLKWFEGPLEVVGAVILPTLAVVGLLLVPFIDRGVMRLVRQRTGAIGLVLLAAIFWGGLTARTVATTPETREMDMSMVEPWQEISAGNMASIGFFRRAQCGSCHELGKSGVGPDLTAAPSSRPASWLEEHMKSNAKAPGALTDAQVQALVTLVTKRSDKAVDAWRNAPQSAVEGALVYQAHACASCHRLNDAGNDLGPPLNGVGERRDRAWIEGHFANPPKYSSGSIMPRSQFEPDQLKLITDYIMAIPK